MQANNSDAALLAAVETGDLAKADEAVAVGANVNAPNRFHVTPLIEAIRQKRLEMARWLIKRGADFDYSGMSEGSPLMLAAYTGDGGDQKAA